jgi:archaellin
MPTNKRRWVAALGLVAVMTGVVFGTGAFTQVQAERTVDVDVADDANALLGIYETTGEYTQTSSGPAGANTVQIVLNDSSGADGVGVNDRAVTTVNSVINISNQGTQPVDISVDSAPTGVNLTGLPADSVGVGDNVTVGVNVSTDPDVSISGGQLTGDVQQGITINATATP